MKSLILALLCLSGAYAFGGCENSTMRIHTDRNLPIKVYIDGRTGANPPTESVTVREIYPGRHRLKVLEVYYDSYGSRVHRVAYEGTINVHASVWMEARVDEGRGVAVHDTHVDCEGQAQRGNQPQGEGGQQPPRYDNAPNPSQAIVAHMSDADFEKMKNAITAIRYETKKMDTLKVLISGGAFAVSQVSDLMNLFAFESNKLQVAELMYPNTVDKQNYKSLESNFNFEARKKDFEKFLGGN